VNDAESIHTPIMSLKNAASMGHFNGFGSGKFHFHLALG
jgi:hypothetical protein